MTKKTEEKITAKEREIIDGFKQITQEEIVEMVEISKNKDGGKKLMEYLKDKPWSFPAVAGIQVAAGCDRSDAMQASDVIGAAIFYSIVFEKEVIGKYKKVDIENVAPEGTA